MSPSDAPSPVARFMPEYDIREVHRIDVAAPADDAFAIACTFELEAIPIVRALFVVRRWLLGGRSAPPVPHRFLDEMLAIGWTPLVRTDRLLVMGSITEPWTANPRFAHVDPAGFATFAEAGHVRIVWSLEAIACGASACTLLTETRAVGTDPASRRRFRWYWRAFGIGTALIRIAALRHVKKIAERRA